MSKNISINNYDKPDMTTALHKGIEEAYKDKMKYAYGYYDDDYDEYYGLGLGWSNDDYDDDDEYYDEWATKERQKRLKELEDAFGFKKAKKHKSRPRYKKAKKEIEVKDETKLDDKEIYFYRDISDRYDYEVFNNLFEFDEFCETEGISVPDRECEDLVRRYVSHCCIDEAYSRFVGTLTLVTNSSYTDLVWDCASSEEQFADETMES